MKFLVEPVMCPGRPDSRCNYDAHCGRVCNKCGRIHDGYANPNGTITSRGHAAPPDQMRRAQADAARAALEQAATYLTGGRYMVLEPLRTYSADEVSNILRAHDKQQAAAIKALAKEITP